MSVRSVGLCTGTTDKGSRCRRRVANSEYCYQHLEKVKGLKIKPSHIAGGGMGLYAQKSFSRGSVVTDYGGSIVQSRDPNFGGDYVLQLSARKFLDARKSNSGAGRFANDCRPANQRAGQCPGNNSQLESDPRNSHNADIIATSSIHKGQEVFTSYGAQYWRNHDARRKRPH
jgi:hypothetical protein